MVADKRNFTRAAEALSLTQPAVSHHINQLEKELNVMIFTRRGTLQLTPQGEIVVKYARRLKAIYEKMNVELINAEGRRTNLKIGITHTAESNLITEAIAKYSSENNGVTIMIITDTIKNLYAMLDNYEIDIAVVEGKPTNTSLSSLMIDTDYLVCALSINNPLARKSMITLNDLKKQRMILRLPTSATRILFESHLASINDSIDNFNITLEVDNIATIKDLIRKDLGVSILARSACMDEVRKGKLAVLPIENLSMIREMNIVYKKDFSHIDILQDIIKLYQETGRRYG